MTTRLENKKKTVDLLKYVEKIALLAKESEMKKEFLNKNKVELKALSAFLEITDLQSAIFCVILSLNFGHSSVDLDDIAGYIGCSPMSILGYMPELDELLNKGIISFHENSHNRSRMGGFNINSIKFYVNKEILDSLMKGVKLKRKTIEIPDIYALMSHLTRVFSDFNDGEYIRSELFREVQGVLCINKELPFLNALEEYSLSFEDNIFFLLLCTEFFGEEESTDLHEAIRFMYGEIGERMRVRKTFLRGTHSLIKASLVKLDDGHFRSDKRISLTESGIELLLGDDKDLVSEGKKNKKKSSDILASGIAPKELYFSGKETKSLEFLTDILKPENTVNLVQRMKDAGMRTGVAVLLYGPPGTGKTESVYQLARTTGRDIHMISISETKSMWFGESEKLIKKVFDEYRTKVEKSKVAPILLFNEADGIFGSRKKIGSSAVDQTENAIQNIILQEMEDLQGILIATTNLTQNLDQAFERRFLYKISFEKPDVEARIRIWQDKINDLSMDDARQLSQSFEFSGGQIENVARKCLMQQLLYGSFPAFNEIDIFCQEEQITRAGIQKIGFTREPAEIKFRATA
jgi:hypothetical protein